MQDIVSRQENLEIVEGAVIELLINNGACVGVKLECGRKIQAKTTIITTGTYLKSRVMVGSLAKSEGPDGQKTTTGLSTQLRELGFNIQRLKTGTPPRVLDKSINYEKTRLEPGLLKRWSPAEPLVARAPSPPAPHLVALARCPPA